MTKPQPTFAAATINPPPTPATVSTNQRNKRRHETPTTILSLDGDILCTIFAFLNMFDLVRCSLVCKFWNAILESRSLREYYEKKLLKNCSSSSEFTKKSLRVILREVGMEQHRLALKCGVFHVDHWKGHSTM
jgi:hypothetical protein